MGAPISFPVHGPLSDNAPDCGYGCGLEEASNPLAFQIRRDFFPCQEGILGRSKQPIMIGTKAFTKVQIILVSVSDMGSFKNPMPCSSCPPHKSIR